MLNRNENTNITPTFGTGFMIIKGFLPISTLKSEPCYRSSIFQGIVIQTNPWIVGEILALLYSEGFSKFESSAPEAKSLYRSWIVYDPKT